MTLTAVGGTVRRTGKIRMNNSIISTHELKKYYTVGENTVKALDGVNMSVNKGEFICIAGRSGSGKSTLLNMLAWL